MAAATLPHARRNAFPAARTSLSAAYSYPLRIEASLFQHAAFSVAIKRKGKKPNVLSARGNRAHHSVVQCSAEKSLYNLQEQLLKDGFAVLPSELVITAPARNRIEDDVVFKFLLPVDGEIPNSEIARALDVAAECDASWLDTIIECSPGFGCLDGTHCPDPSWVQNNWQVRQVYPKKLNPGCWMLRFPCS